MSTGGFLLLRQAGSCWGVSGPAVRSVERVSRGFVVTLANGSLMAEEVLGVVESLRVWPLAAAAHGGWPAGAVGTAVYAGQPLLVVDAARPPRALLYTQEDPE